MDWGLVLISQGIETTIDCAEEGAGWGLIVASQDYENALNVIRQYRLENRLWPWRREVFAAKFLFDAGSVVWAVLIIAFYWLATSQTSLREIGLMDSSAVARGQWWRLFTAVFLHGDLAHLATNVTIGILLLGLAMGRCGTGIGLLAAYLAGVAGNLAAWLVYTQPHRGLGASGMVLGALGLLAAHSLAVWRRSPLVWKQMARGLGGGVMLFVLLGLTPGTDIVAHGGGFVAGLLIGLLLTPVPNLAQRPVANLMTGLLFTALAIWTWALAMTQGI